MWEQPKKPCATKPLTEKVNCKELHHIQKALWWTKFVIRSISTSEVTRKGRPSLVDHFFSPIDVDEAWAKVAKQQQGDWQKRLHYQFLELHWWLTMAIQETGRWKEEHLASALYNGQSYLNKAVCLEAILTRKINSQGLILHSMLWINIYDVVQLLNKSIAVCCNFRVWTRKKNNTWMSLENHLSKPKSYFEKTMKIDLQLENKGSIKETIPSLLLVSFIQLFFRFTTFHVEPTHNWNGEGTKDGP